MLCSNNIYDSRYGNLYTSNANSRGTQIFLIQLIRTLQVVLSTFVMQPLVSIVVFLHYKTI